MRESVCESVCVSLPVGEYHCGRVSISVQEFRFASASHHTAPHAKHATRKMHAGVGVDRGGDGAQAAGARGGGVPDTPVCV